MLRNNQGFIEKIMTRLNVKGYVIAKAEEPTTDNVETTPQPVVSSTINYEDLIARARKEEKDKLYPKIQKLEAENTALVEKHNKALLELGNKDTKLSEMEATIEKLKTTAKNSDSEEVKELKAEIKNLKAKVKEYEANQIDPETIRNEVVAEYEVKLYKEQKLREVGETVIPELVFGSTKEEIDNSLKVAQERYQAIVGKFATPNVPPVNVNTSSMVTKEVNVEDVSKMSPFEWAEYRKKLGLR